jgi:hypothetical protein
MSYFSVAMDYTSPNCTIPPCQSAQIPLCQLLQRSVIFPNPSNMHLVISYTTHFISIPWIVKRKVFLLSLMVVENCTDTTGVTKSLLNQMYEVE